MLRCYYTETAVFASVFVSRPAVESLAAYKVCHMFGYFEFVRCVACDLVNIVC